VDNFGVFGIEGKNISVPPMAFKTAFSIIHVNICITRNYTDTTKQGFSDFWHKDKIF
jgi:hypothetical protein